MKPNSGRSFLVTVLIMRVKRFDPAKEASSSSGAQVFLVRISQIMDTIRAINIKKTGSLS